MSLSIVSKIKSKIFGHNNHLFIVVIPFYNAENWIEKCINSVKNQTYEKYNCILIDDLSSDKSFTIAKKLIKKDKKFNLIKRNTKSHAALNIAKGISFINPLPDDIIINLDGDDWLENKYVFEILNKKYNQYKCWMTYGSYKTWPDNNRGLFSRKISDEIINKQSYRENTWMSSHLRTYKFKLWNKINQRDLFNEETGKPIKAVGDQAIMFPLLEMSGHRALYIDDILYVNNRDNPINEDKVNHPFQNDEEKYIRNKIKYPLLKKI